MAPGPKDRSLNRPTTTRDALPFLHPPEELDEDGNPIPVDNPNAPPLPVPIRRPVEPGSSGRKD